MIDRHIGNSTLNLKPGTFSYEWDCDENDDMWTLKLYLPFGIYAIPAEDICAPTHGPADTDRIVLKHPLWEYSITKDYDEEW